jgi:4-amino-4-deoxy-L-arabinose transferase-like glycosyltransferase
VLVVALFFNTWGLTTAGYGNTYYAAAVRSMTESWHNFFFGAFDPGGFITVDKPPVFLWIDALFARVFGYSTTSLLLPTAIAGTAAVGLLWLTVRRYFGVFAATIAGLALAVTPISVAVNRLNLPEAFYILALVGAAACILRSLDSGRWLWWVIGAGVLVGIAFNTKMLAAWIPGPALALALIVGAPGPWRDSWRRWLPRVTALGVATLVVSASWMLVVDHWPGDRPYVGGSSDNSVQDLILGYNGFERVEGFDNSPTAGSRVGPAQRGGIVTTGRNGPGGIIAGEPNPLRMFDAANGGQIAWLLPFALLGGVVALWYWRDSRLARASVVMWFGWIVLFGGVFSYTQGIYHSYYTAAMAPAIAAMAGVSAVALAGLINRNREWLAVLLGIALATVGVQLTITRRFDGFFEWADVAMVAAVAAGLVLIGASLVRQRVPLMAGMAVMVAGFLLIPTAWSQHETANVSLNTTLPQAGPREGAAGRTFGSNAFDNGISNLAVWLERNNATAAKWSLAVTSAQNASTLIARHNVPVLALGGFSGRDPTLSAVEFASLIDEGNVRYVLTNGGFSTRRPPPSSASQQPSSRGAGGLPGAVPGSGVDAPRGAGAVISAVQSTCALVTDRTLPVEFRGQIYDCAGKGAALALSGR